MRVQLGLMLLVAGVQACGSSSTYIPEEKATATLGGRTAASYALPSERNEQGGLRVASYGVSKLEQKGNDPLKAIHLRLAVSDNGEQPMVLDTRAQRLQLPDGRQLAPAYVRARASVPPLIRSFQVRSHRRPVLPASSGHRGRSQPEPIRRHLARERRRPDGHAGHAFRRGFRRSRGGPSGAGRRHHG